MLYTFPPSTVHASAVTYCASPSGVVVFLRRPLCCFSSEGGTRISDAGCEERKDGDEVSRAQSRGEWPGVRRTFFRGLVGGALCVGGGERVVLVEGGPRLGSGEGREGGGIKLEVPREGGAIKLEEPREGGAMSPPREGVGVGFETEGGVGIGLRAGGFARWAEFSAGKEGGGRLSVSSSSSSYSSGEVARLNDGMVVFELALVDARGVVGDDGFANSGGGGMALRSSSALVGASLRFTSTSWSFTIHSSTLGGAGLLSSRRCCCCFAASLRGVPGGSTSEGRRIHSRSAHANGGRR